MQRVTKVNARNLARMRDNIIEVWATATVHERAQGEQWYERAHTEACSLGQEANLTTTAAAGIIAALSPQVEWGRNVEAAYMVANGFTPPAILGRSIQKAERIRNGEHPNDVLSGDKVRAFWHLIEHPHSQEGVVCVDRHAFDVAVGYVTDDRTRKALERVGIYVLFSEAYRLASERVGALPHVVQATTWVTWKGVKSSNRTLIAA